MSEVLGYEFLGCAFSRHLTVYSKYDTAYSPLSLTYTSYSRIVEKTLLKISTKFILGENIGYFLLLQLSRYSYCKVTFYTDHFIRVEGIGSCAVILNKLTFA